MTEKEKATNINDETVISKTFVESITDAAQNAKHVYLTYVGFYIYCTLTISSATDKQLILNESVYLPIINIDVSFIGFILFTPLLGMIIYSYLQTNLSLLAELASKQHKKYVPEQMVVLYPWISNVPENTLAKAKFKVQKIIIDITIWWSLPVLLLVIVLWSIKKHDRLFSYYIGVLPLLGNILVIWFLQNEGFSLRNNFFKKATKYILLVTTLVFEVFYYSCLIPWALDGGKFKLLKPLLCADLSYQKLVSEPEIDYENLYWIGLRKSHLEGASLVASILRKADLRYSYLIDADLTRADLSNADLFEAKIDSACFRYANLSSAYLRKASLMRVDFKYCKLDSANFTLANLAYANFKYANLKGTNFEEAKLQGAKNLTIDQLKDVKSLRNAIMDSLLHKEMETKYPHLFR